MINFFKNKIKKFLYQKYSRIFLILQFVKNLSKSNKIPIKFFKIDKIKFSMYSSENFQNKEWQFNETKVILKILKKINLFINVGANYGYYICLASKFNLKIIAIEPNYFNYKILLKNITLNKIKDIIAIPMAAFNKNQLMPLYGDGVTSSLFYNWDNAKYRNDIVATFKLSDLINLKLLNKNSLILIDAENSEYNILLGAKDIINSKNPPIWILECHSKFYSNDKIGNTNMHKIFYLFKSSNYNIYLIGKNNLIQVSDSNFEYLIKKKNNHKNFLFINKKKTNQFKYLIKE